MAQWNNNGNSYRKSYTLPIQVAECLIYLDILQNQKFFYSFKQSRAYPYFS